MKLSDEDLQLLNELCFQNNVNFNKVRKLLETVHGYEFKERRTGVFEVLRKILNSSPATEG